MKDTRKYIRFHWKLATRNNRGKLINHDGGPYRDKENCRAIAYKVRKELIRRYGSLTCHESKSKA